MIILILGCSSDSANPALTSPASEFSIKSLAENSTLGIYVLNIDKSSLFAQLTSLRKPAHTDVLEAVDLTNFLAMSPCIDCAKIASVGLNSDNNIVLSIGIKHPFPAGDISQPISAKNRADLHVFNVEGIVISNDPDCQNFPGINKKAARSFLQDADGYTNYLDASLDDSIFSSDADIHPYILHFDDYSTGNYSPFVPTGFISVTNPGPDGNLVMPMGSDYDFKDYIFNIDGEMSFIYAIECTYPIATLSYTQRFQPEYRIPQHLKKAASEVHIIPPIEKLKVANPLYEVKVQVEIVDRSHGVVVGNALDQMKYDSSVDSVLMEIPGIFTGTKSFNGNQAVSGSGHSTSDPLLYEFSISNELTALVGTYFGLVKIVDSYPTGSNELINISGKDGLKRLPPGSSTLDGIFEISQFATYQIFQIEVEEGTINPPTYYDVGPGYPYADPSEVPWESIEENSIVRIHWRDEPYRDKWVIARAGTLNEPIIVQGIPDQDRLPVISGENAKTRLELDYWNESRSVIKVGGSSFPNERPSYIIIENLDIRSAHENYSFADDQGSEVAYSANAASVHIESGDHITLRNCILHDSGNGLFVSSDSTGILIHGNYIYDNGNTSSAYEHNSYTEALGIVFEFNHYGLLKTGSEGNNLKDRSAGTVIRYNWIESGSRMCDLVDSGDDDLLNDPAYHETFVYGNILVKDSLHGNGGVIHYGGDSVNTDNYRKGTLWFYNNTVISYRTTRTTLLQISSNDEDVECFNNLFFDEEGGNQFFMMGDYGNVNFYNNWLQTGWQQVNGTLQGTINVHDNLEGTDPDFVDFSSQDFHINTTSACQNSASDLPSSLLPDHDLIFQYVKHQGSENRPNDADLDIGAFEAE
jgi:hypothetical protein